MTKRLKTSAMRLLQNMECMLSSLHLMALANSQDIAVILSSLLCQMTSSLIKQKQKHQLLKTAKMTERKDTSLAAFAESFAKAMATILGQSAKKVNAAMNATMTKSFLLESQTLLKTQ